MARVDQYTTEVFLDRAHPENAQSIGGIGFNSADQHSLNSDMYARRGAAMQRYGDQIQKQRDVQGQINARERFNEYQRGRIEYEQNLKNQRMQSPDGFAKEFDDWQRVQGTEIEDQMLSGSDQPFDTQYFRQLMDNDRTSSYEQNLTWENGMRVRNISTGIEKNLDAMNANFSLTKPGLKDLKKQISNIRDYVNTTGAQVLAPDQLHKFAAYGIDQATTGVVDNMLENNPRALRDVMMYGTASKDQLIGWVFDIEGQDKIAKEPNGGIAKYGINSVANGLTEEQVRNLTPEQASEILAKKYWDPRLDKMDPAFRAVAFDALVNHGNDKNTWAMIDASKGDPYTLIAMRQDYYQSLATMDPGKYAEYLPGWDNRMKQVSGYVQALENGGNEFLQYASMVDPKIIMNTQAQIPNAIAAKDRADTAEKNKRISEFNTTYKDAYDTLTNDLEPLGQDELNVVMQAAQNSGDPASIMKANALSDMRNYVNNIKGLSDDQLRAVVRKSSALVNKDPTPQNRLALELAQGVLDNQIKGVKSEGLAYWGRIGEIAMPMQIDYSNPDAAVGELRKREDASMKVYQKTGDLLPVLTPDEIDTMKEQISSMPANKAARLLSYFDALDQSSKAKLAQSIDEKSPILATAISTDNLDARRRILFGSKIEPKYKKADMQAEIYSMLDPMVFDPEFKASASESIMAWYNAKSQEDRDFEPNISTDRIKEGIEQIYGPIANIPIGNTDNVFSFKDPETGDWVNEDDLYDAFNGMTDSDLEKITGEKPTGSKGEAVTMRDIKKSGRIISAGYGLYNIVFGKTGAIYNQSGDPLEIDGRKVLRTWKRGGAKRTQPPVDSWDAVNVRP